MLRIIPGLLTPAEVKEIVDELETSEFVDGRSSAGRKARQVKKNLHLVQGSQRSRELGLRMALGAQGKHIELMVLRRTFAIAGVGTIVGLGIALAVTRLMSSLLYGVSAVDPLTYVLVPSGLLVVAVLASYGPARRASRVDAMDVLRRS